MKAQEANLILLLAFEHEPDTRAEYYKIEAEKSGYSYPVFWSELFEAYKRFEAVVNSTDFRTYGTNEPGGEKHYHKKCIALFHITGGRLPFTLNSENLTELLIPLRDFGALALPEATSTSEPQAIAKKLSLKQIALIYIYNGELITRANGEAIAKSYKYTSGEKLFQDFTYYSSPKNRTAYDTEKKGKNKIELIESIIPLLKNEACKKVATNELNTLKSKLGIDIE